MRLFDITQEIFTCAVYPGHPAPEREILARISEGRRSNLSAFRMCTHNGTHVDAPRHFLPEGKTIDQVELRRFVGYAFVAEHAGALTGADAETLLKRAAEADGRAAERLLIKGDAFVTPEAARVFAGAGLLLFGNESQTVGPEDAPVEVHRVMLDAEIVLLEGIRLGDVPEGVYLLCAAPLNLGGAEGAPCRAVLIAEEGDAGPA